MWKRGIESLSVEVLGRVLGELDSDDLVSASSVCRHWFDVVNIYLLRRKQSAILRPEVEDFVPDWPLKNLSLVGFSNEQFARIKGICAHLDALHIGYEGFQERLLNETVLTGLLEDCLDLKQISFKNVLPSDPLLQVILDHGITTLQSVSFECSSSKLNGRRTNKILERLHFPETKLVVRPSNNRHEQFLIARYPFSFNNPITFVNIAKSITTVDIDCYSFTKDAYRCFKACKSLRSVRLLNSFQIDDEAVIDLTKLPKLNELCLTDARNVTTLGWAAIFHCAGITHVSLTRCASGLSDIVFQNSTGASHTLELDLQNCKRVTGQGLLPLLRIPANVSLKLDYSEELLDSLTDNVILGLASRMRNLEVTVQRVRATSDKASIHSSKIKQDLSQYCQQHGIKFSYNQLFTKVHCVQRSVRTI